MRSQDTARPLHQFDPAEGHPQRGQILAISCLSLVIIVIAVSSLNVAIPSLIEELSPSSTQLLWIIDAYALVFAGFLLLAGAVGDRFGRKGALLTGLTIFGLGSVVASQMTDPNLLIAVRAVMGIGAALVMPATLSIVTSVFPPAERSKAIATWAGFAGAGGALGPILGGLLVERFGWASVFFINVPLVLIGIALIALRVPSSRDTQQRSLDLVGAILSVLALASLLFGIIEGPENGWGSVLVLAAFGAFLVLGAAFIAWELHTDEPMLDPRFFAIPAFRAGSIVVTSLFFGLFGMFFVLTQYLQGVKGYSPLLAGLATLPSAVTMVVLTPRSPKIVAAVGTRKVVVTGMVLVSAGFALFAQLGPGTPYVVVAIGLVIIAAGMSLAMAPSSTSIVSSLPIDKAGVASAVNDVTREVGGALGIAVLGSVLSAGYSSAVASAIPASAPEQLRAAASSSIGPAMEIAKTLPESLGDTLRSTARVAFSDAMGNAFWVSSGVLLVMAIVVARSIPDTREAGMH